MNRWHAFTQLLLARLREFFREPHAIFWVYGFPLILAVGLGVAFSKSEPQPPTVDIQETPGSGRAQDLAEALRVKRVSVALGSADDCADRLRSGKIALYIVPSGSGYRF